jgi:hypothetical protein
MKRLALFFIIGLSLAGTVWAQQAGSTPASPPNLPPGAPFVGANQITITPDEWQELRTARSEALKSNPDLVAANKKLMDRMRALEDKIDAAMVKADPTIAPIIAKFETNRPHPGVPVGSPPSR